MTFYTKGNSCADKYDTGEVFFVTLVQFGYFEKAPPNKHIFVIFLLTQHA